MVNDRGVGQPDGRRAPDGQPAVAADQGHRLGQQPAVRQHQRACGEDDLRRPHPRPAAGPRGGHRRHDGDAAGGGRPQYPAKRRRARRGRTRRSGSTRRSASSSGRWPPAATSSCTPITRRCTCRTSAVTAAGRRVAHGAGQRGGHPVRRRSHGGRRTCGSSAGRSVSPSTARSAVPGDALKVRAEAVDVASVNTLMLGTAADWRHAERERHRDGHTRGAARRCDVLDHERLVPRVPGTSRSRARSRTPSTACGSTRGSRRRRMRGSRRRGSCRRRSSKPADPAETAAAARPTSTWRRAPGEELDIAVTSSTLSLGLIAGLRAAGHEGERHAAGRRAGDGITAGSASERGDRHPQRRLHRRRADEERIHGLRHADHAGARSRPDSRSSACSTSTSTRYSVSGELAVHQRQIGGVQIAIKSDQFEIIDNQLADIKLNSDLRITGELPAAPRRRHARRAHRHDRRRPGARVDHEQCVRGGADEARGGGAGAVPPPVLRASGAPRRPPRKRPRTLRPRAARIVGAGTAPAPLRRHRPARPGGAGALPPASSTRSTLDVRLSMPEQRRGQGHGSQPVGRIADRARRRQRHDRRRRAGDQEAGRQGAADRHREHGARHVRLPGPPLRYPARRPDPVLRDRRRSTRRSTSWRSG